MSTTATATEDRLIPGSASVPATAVCPRCENLVYNDRLELTGLVVGVRGEEVPTRLVIDCGICGRRSTVRYLSS